MRSSAAAIAEASVLNIYAVANAKPEYTWVRRIALLASDAGTVTVEFMLWVPLIFTLILFAVDVALIYLNQANMWTAARDQARRLSVSSTYTDANFQTNGKAELFTGLQNASSLSLSETGATRAGTDKIVTIQVNLCDASLFGIVGCFNNTFKLTAKVTMASEY